MIETFMNYLLRLYPGSNLEPSKRKMNDIAISIGKGNKSISIPVGSKLYRIIREENFSALELRMITIAQTKIEKLTNDGFNSVMKNTIIENTFDELILTEFIEFNQKFNTPNEHSLEFIDELLKALAYWRNKTYEGKSISLGIIICPDV